MPRSKKKDMREDEGELTGPAHQEDKGILVNTYHQIPGKP